MLGDDGPNGWGIRYAREFDMTNDSRLFPPRPQWEAQGYRPDEYSRWLLGDWRPIGELWAEMGVDASRPMAAAVKLEDWLFDSSAGPERRAAEARFVHGHLLKPGDVARTNWRMRCAQPPYDGLPVPRAAIPAGVVLSRQGDAWIREDRVRGVALPLYEGRMIGQFDSSQKGWVSGKGRGAVWREIPWGRKQVEPQFLMAAEHYEDNLPSSTPSTARPKVAIMDITSSTNARTMISAPLAGVPCGHSIGVLNCPVDTCLQLSTALNSYVYDFCLRVRFSGLHTSWFILEETPLPFMDNDFRRGIERLSERLVKERGVHGVFAADFFGSALPALTHHERLRVSVVLNALLAYMFGLNVADMRHVLQQCDLPTLDSGSLPSAQLGPKGLWRLDRDQHPELRQTVLALVAFVDLQAHSSPQNAADGWQIPETLRLADYGLGHDERAKAAQPVAGRLGPRFYDWQLAQPADQAHSERQLHVRNLLGELRYARLLRDGVHPHRNSVEEPLREVAEPRATYDVRDRPVDRQDIFD